MFVQLVPQVVSYAFCRFIGASFFECFLQLSVFISSLTAKIILDNFISEGTLSKTYPPLAPLALFTSLFFLT